MKKILTFLASCLVLIAFFLAFPSSAKAAIPFENATDLRLDRIYLVEITNKTDYGIFKFTPTETAVYSFASLEDDDADAYCEMYDAAGNFLTYNDYYTIDDAFRIVYTMQAGQTYYFTPHVSRFEKANTSLNVRLTKTDEKVTNIVEARATLSGNSAKASIESDKLGNLYLSTDNNLSDSTLQLCFADGTTEKYTYVKSRFVNTVDSTKVLYVNVRKNFQLCDVQIADKREASLEIPDYRIAISVSMPYAPKVKSFTYTPQKEGFFVEQTQKPGGNDFLTAADLIVTYTDGTQKTFSNKIGDSNYTLQRFKNIADTSEAYDLKYSDNCDFSKLGTTTVQMGFIDKIENIPVTVSENSSGLESFSFTPDTEIKLTEASYYNSDVWYGSVKGTITVTKKDDTIETYTGSKNKGFKDANGKPMPYFVSYLYDSCYAWKVGQNSYPLYLENLVCMVPVTIVGVTNAAFVPKEPVVLPHSDEYDCDVWYRGLEGTITIYLSDGTQKSYSGSVAGGFYNEDHTEWCPVRTSHKDSDTYGWHVGSDNYFDFRIERFSCPVSVTITHDLESVSENSATCITNGRTGYRYCHCSDCDYKTESTVIPATGHTDGNGDHICDVCNEEFAFNVTQPIDVSTVCKRSATFTTDTSEPSCTYQWYQDGSILDGETDKTLTLENVTYDTHNGKTYSCMVMNAEGKSVTTSPATLSISHDFISQTIKKDPTCTSYGSKIMTCVCGYKDSFLVKYLGHTYVTKDAVPATCIKEGYSGNEVCDVCGRTKNKGHVLPITGHSAVSALNGVAPTCMAAGKESDVICGVCQKVLETGREIPATGHRFGNNGPVCQICNTANPDYKEPVKTPTTQEKINELAKKYGISAKTLALNEKTITAAKGNSDLAGAEFKKLKLRQKKTTKNSISISWSKVSGADGYIVYAGAYGSKLKKAATLTGKVTSYTHKKLKANKYYKYVVVAYKDVDGRKVTLSASKTIFVTTKNGKYDNPKTLKVAKSKLSVKKGKKMAIRVSLGKTAKKVKKLAAIRFESSDPKIATVSAKGVVKGIGKGSCKIYVYAQNGVAKTVKVTVE